MSRKSYRVHLLDEDAPVETEYVDFYDSGVWLDHDEGRVFYPYERVGKVEEVREGEDESTDVQ